MALRPHTRRRVLAVGLAGSLFAVVLDQAAPGVSAPVRRVAAEAFAPVQSVLTGGDDDVDRLRRERDAAVRGAGDSKQNAATLTQLRKLLGSAPADGRRLVAARVIGYTTAATAGTVDRVTIDVGTDDGIRTDLTVIAADGLVGRVVAVAGSSATVRLLGDPATTVGARVGEARILATVSATVPTGLATRAPGLLSVRVAGTTQVRVGDTATTLGSIDQTPYVSGVPIGTVVSVDPDRGQGAPTAVLRPAVDPARLDLVAVVLPGDRVARPTLQGG